MNILTKLEEVKDKLGIDLTRGKSGIILIRRAFIQDLLQYHQPVEIARALKTDAHVIKLISATHFKNIDCPKYQEAIQIYKTLDPLLLPKPPEVVELPVKPKMPILEVVKILHLNKKHQALRRLECEELWDKSLPLWTESDWRKLNLIKKANNYEQQKSSV
jgi:hypothetical protein